MGERVFVTEFYEPVLTEYDAAGNVKQRFQLPLRESEPTSDLWRGQTLDAEQRRAIRIRMHTMTALTPIGDRLFFFEVHHASNLIAPVLFDPNTSTARRFPKLRLLRGDRGPGQGCSFRAVLGTDGRSLIVLLDEPEQLSQCAHDFPALRSVQSDVVQMPVLLFLSPRLLAQ